MIRNIILNILTFLVVLSFTACSMTQELIQSQIETPTLEAQANRVAIGMGIIRENNIIMNMKLSSDAKWPLEMSQDISPEQEKLINEGLSEDPYFATHQYSDMIQMQMLGGYGNVHISALTYRAFQKILILYGEDRRNWPSFFTFSPDLSNFNTFQDGNLKEITAISGDEYENTDEAIISLMPVGYRKNLLKSLKESRQEADKVVELEGEKGELETILKADVAKQSKEYEEPYTPLSMREKQQIETQISVLETKIDHQQEIADEKEEIYYTILDEAVEVLQSDINLDEEHVKLARNIKLVSENISDGAGEATALFAIAIANISLKDVIQNIPKEIASLIAAKAIAPKSMQQKLNERIERLKNNAIYLIPTIGMGSYYAIKQKSMANKYALVADIIIEAADAKLEAQKMREKENEK
jgi:hypothetical protein